MTLSSESTFDDLTMALDGAEDFGDFADEDEDDAQGDTMAILHALPNQILSVASQLSLCINELRHHAHGLTMEMMGERKQFTDGPSDDA
jgi:hypothetical protein